MRLRMMGVLVLLRMVRSSATMMGSVGGEWRAEKMVDAQCRVNQVPIEVKSSQLSKVNRAASDAPKKDNPSMGDQWAIASRGASLLAVEADSKLTGIADAQSPTSPSPRARHQPS
jgi:hypothetical protein